MDMIIAPAGYAEPVAVWRFAGRISFGAFSPELSNRCYGTSATYSYKQAGVAGNFATSRASRALCYETGKW